MSTELCVVGLVYFELDVTSAVQALRATTPGQEIFVERLPARLGGALNTASVARALDCNVVLCHPLGRGPTDCAVEAVIADLSIETQTWPATDDPAISLVVRTEGDRAFVSAADIQLLEACPELPAARWVHVPGLHEAELLAPRLRAVRERGSLVSVSGSWAPASLTRLSANVRSATHTTNWDLLQLNAEEASCIAGNREKWATLRALASEVLVTDGEHGAMLFGPDGIDHVDAAPAEVVDATGAGDAFAAGFLVGRLHGKSVRAALELGAAAAAEILSIPGGVAHRTESFRALSAGVAR